MYPPISEKMRSLGSQFRFFIKVGEGKWLFMVSRYPADDPMHYDNRLGRQIYGTGEFRPRRPKRMLEKDIWLG